MTDYNIWHLHARHATLETAYRAGYEHANEQIEELRQRINDLERGEYICKQCGRRKNGEFTGGDF